jgi:hypothetical protein
LLVVFWAGWALWAVSSDRGRFFLPHLAVLAAAAGEGLTGTRGRTAALLALALLHFARGAAKLEQPGGWQVAVGELSADAYLAEPRLGYPTPSRAVLRSLEGAGAVLLVGETRAYGSPVPALWGSELDVQPLARLARESRDGEDLFRRLQALEVRWLLVDLPEAARLPAHAFPWDAASWAVFEGFWRAHVVELPPGAGPVRLYGLTEERRGPVPELPFMPMASRGRKVPGAF